MNFKHLLVLYLFLLFGVSNVMAQGSAFENSIHQFHTELPEGWQQSELINARVFEFIHPESIATLSITVHHFEETVTLNAFKQQHVTSRYDGWQNLFERPGTELEAFKAGATESHVAVYGKTILDDRLNVTQQIVGEYYFLKEGEKGYVLTVKSLKNHWKQIQRDVKVFVDNFWVGLEKQKVFYGAVNKEGIVQPAYLDAVITPESINVSMNVEHIIADFTDDIQFSESPDALLYTNTKQLAAYFPEAPSQNWQLQSDYKLLSNIVHYNELSVTVVDSKEPAIRTFFRQSGLIYKEIPIESKRISDLAIYGDYIFLIQNGNLAAYHIHTGDKKLEIEGPFDPEFTPIITQQSVFLQRKNKVLACYALNTQSLKWGYTSPTSLINIIIDPELGAFIASTQKVEKLNLSTGSIITPELFPPLTPTSSITGIYLAKNVLVTKVKTDTDTNVFNAYTADTGEKIWTYQEDPNNFHNVKNHVYISPQFMWINQKKSIVVLDINTGIPTKFDHVQLQDTENNIHSLHIINGTVHVIAHTPNQSKYNISPL